MDLAKQLRSSHCLIGLLATSIGEVELWNACSCMAVHYHCHKVDD